MGLGVRHEPLDVMPWKHPGVGTYDLAKHAAENSNPTWKFGTGVKKVVIKDDWPLPGVDDGLGDLKEYRYANS